MPTINQKKEIISMMNSSSLKKTLFEKAVLRETSPVLLEEYKKAVAQAEGALRAMILVANTLKIPYSASRMKVTDLDGLCKEHGIDPGRTAGAVFFDGYELDGLQTDRADDAGEILEAN